MAQLTKSAIKATRIVLDTLPENKYLHSQFCKVLKSDYPTQIQIANDTGETNWLNVTENQLEQIKEILLYTE